MDEAKLKQLYETCQKFITEQRIHCAETVWQCDWVSEHALELVEDVCEIVGYYKDPEDSTL